MDIPTDALAMAMEKEKWDVNPSRLTQVSRNAVKTIRILPLADSFLPLPKSVFSKACLFGCLPVR